MRCTGKYFPTLTALVIFVQIQHSLYGAAKNNLISDCSVLMCSKSFGVVLHVSIEYRGHNMKNRKWKLEMHLETEMKTQNSCVMGLFLGTPELSPFPVFDCFALLVCSQAFAASSISV